MYVCELKFSASYGPFKQTTLKLRHSNSNQPTIFFTLQLDYGELSGNNPLTDRSTRHRDMPKYGEQLQNSDNRINIISEWNFNNLFSRVETQNTGLQKRDACRILRNRTTWAETKPCVYELVTAVWNTVMLANKKRSNDQQHLKIVTTYFVRPTFHVEMLCPLWVIFLTAKQLADKQTARHLATISLL